MDTIKNPARSRPLSANVRRLMTMSREAPRNPKVETFERKITARDLLYCDMQGRIFMAAIDRARSMESFAPLFMNSQLAGVIDHSFSVTGSMETDDVSVLLHIPMLLKSPETIVDVVLWLDHIVGARDASDTPGMAVFNAFAGSDIEQSRQKADAAGVDADPITTLTDTEALIRQYEYAYWLGYIYRFECLLHDESSRMVYGAFDEPFMRKTYDELVEADPDAVLNECAGEICKRIDLLLIGKLWKNEKKTEAEK